MSSSSSSSSISSSVVSTSSICDGRCQQQQITIVLQIISAFLSVIGTVLILYIIFTNPASAHVQKRQGRLQRGGASKITYERLMIGLSLADLINSLRCMTGSFPVPKGTPGFWFAIGTEQTCTAQGFFTILSSSTSFYSTSLAIYFVLSMIPSVSEDTIKNRFVPFLHVVSTAIPVILAIIGLALNMYNPLPLGDVCSFAVYPTGCDTNPVVYGECTRGQYAELMTTIMLGFGIISFCSIIICMVTIYMLSWLQHRKMKALYSVTTTTTTAHPRPPQVQQDGTSTGGRRISGIHPHFLRSSLTCVDESNSRVSFFVRNVEAERQLQQQRIERERQNGNSRKLRRIATQGILYIFAYFITWIWKVILVCIFLSNRNDNQSPNEPSPTGIFTIKLLDKFFYPMQGVLNLFIYIRPRFIDLRNSRTSSNLSRIDTLKVIVFANPTLSTKQMNTTTTSNPVLKSKCDNMFRFCCWYSQRREPCSMTRMETPQIENNRKIAHSISIEMVDNTIKDKADTDNLCSSSIQQQKSQSDDSVNEQDQQQQDDDEEERNKSGAI